MTRLILVLVVLVLAYWLVRNVIRGFLSGRNPGNENVRGRHPSRKESYTDVQDADYKDITDEK